MVAVIPGWVGGGGGGPPSGVLSGWPNQGWGVSGSTLNEQRPIEKVQRAIAGFDAPLRFGYGLTRVGPLWLKPVSTQDYLYLPFVVGAGPIDAVEAVQSGDGELPDGITATTYLGTTGQTVDPYLVNAWHAAGVEYDDNLDGIAWGFLAVWRNCTALPAQIGIRARQKILYDPRLDSSIGYAGPVRYAVRTTWVYSNNPALALADFLSSRTYGRGETMDWVSVAYAADVCDEVLDDKPRRTIGLMIDTMQSVAQVEEILRAYAGVWVVREDGKVRFVSDAPGSSVYAFTNASGSANYVADSLKIRQKPRRDVPTVVSVVWTDTSVTPWKSATETVKAIGVDTGELPWREEQIQMPGYHDAGEARREARLRLNRYTTCDLQVKLTAFGEAMQLRRGDVVTVTDSEGLTAKKFRLIEFAPADTGLWAATLDEYDDAIYSDEIAAGPSTPGTTLPLPSNPPALAGLTSVEQTYALATGAIASRAIVSWTAPTFPFARQVLVTVYDGTTQVASALISSALTTWTSGPLQEGRTYTIGIALISSVGAIGPTTTTLLTIAGKNIAPGDVATISGFEAGGRVFLAWTAAVNPTNPLQADPDVWRYEVRRGTTGQAWAAMALVNQSDSLRMVEEGVPAGTWRYRVKAIDSVRQYSTNDAHVDVVVSVDTGAFLVDTLAQTSPTLTNMVAFTLSPTDGKTYWITDDGVAFGTTFSSNLSTYTDALATYHGSVTSTWLGESEDFGLSLSGQWTGTATVAAISGTAKSYLGTSPDGSTWAYVESLSTRQTARYARLKHEALTTSTLLVTAPTETIRVDAVPREESGVIETSASGPVTVILRNAFAAVKSLQVTAQGSASYTATYDMLAVNGFVANPAAPIPTGEEVLQFQHELPAEYTGDASDFWQFASAATYTTGSGDTFEFDYMVVQAAGSTANLLLTIYQNSGDTYIATKYFTGAPLGQWQSGSVACTTGKVIDRVMYVNTNDNIGKTVVLVRNVRITDGAGTTRKVLWQSGVPTLVDFSVVDYENRIANRANAFDVYAFDAGGSKVAVPVQYVIKGV